MAGEYIAPSGMYFVEPIKDNEINLEHIDEELRMEQVRQGAAKMEWATFGQTVRRNLQEKRNTLDADGRIDVLNGIAFMKTRLPIDMNAPLEERLKIFAESLGMTYKINHPTWIIYDENGQLFELCYSDAHERSAATLVFWGESSFMSPTATKMLKSGQWTELRDLIQNILAIYDRSFSRDTREICRNGMLMLEALFFNVSSDDSFAAINGSNYGYYLPRNDLRAGRVYYFVDPHYRSLSAKDKVFNLQRSDWENLPYIEISFVEHEKECSFPEYDLSGEWRETEVANAAVRLKLSKGLVISETTRRILATFTAKAATVKHYINCYRYLSQAVRMTRDGRMITQWPGHKGQQLYTVNGNCLASEGDSVITEIFLKRLQDFHRVIDLLRHEAMHMYLWEGILSACCPRQGVPERVETAIPFGLFLCRPEIVLFFHTKFGPMKLTITDNYCLGVNVRIVNAKTGLPIAERIDEIASRELNKHWSIPIMLTHVVSAADCKLSKVTVPLKELEKKKVPAKPKIIVKND